jgi:hypothetical protein
MAKLRPGVGAKCTVLSRFVKPSAAVRSALGVVHRKGGHSIQVVLVAEALKTVNRKANTEIFTFCSDSVPNVVLFACKRFVKMIEEGPETSLFDTTREPHIENVQSLEVNLPSRGQGLAEDIANF